MWRAVPAAPEAVGSAKAPGDWILLPLLCTPEAAVLRQWADMEPEQPALSDGGWQVRLWENPVFECGSAAAAPEEAAVQERRYDLSAMELRYGHTAACTIPTKVTATQLKGRVLVRRSQRGRASARPRRAGLPEAPLFAAGAQAHRCGTGDGHASGDAVSGVGRPGPGGAGAAAHGSAASDTPAGGGGGHGAHPGVSGDAAGAGDPAGPAGLAGVSLCPADARRRCTTRRRRERN